MFVKFIQDCELRCTPGKDKKSIFRKGDEAELLPHIGDYAVRNAWALILPSLGAIVRPAPIAVAGVSPGKLRLAARFAARRAEKAKAQAALGNLGAALPSPPGAEHGPKGRTGTAKPARGE